MQKKEILDDFEIEPAIIRSTVLKNLEPFISIGYLFLIGFSFYSFYDDSFVIINSFKSSRFTSLISPAFFYLYSWRRDSILYEKGEISSFATTWMPILKAMSVILGFLLIYTTVNIPIENELTFSSSNWGILFINTSIFFLGLGQIYYALFTTCIADN